MNGSAKRMMAMLAAIAMIASAMVVVFADEQDSSADALSDANTYYYDRLETNLARNVYTEVLGLSSFSGLTRTVSVNSADETAMSSDSGYAAEQINRGILSAVYDDPRMVYYLNSTQPVVDHSISHDSEHHEITFTLNKTEQFPGEKSTYDSQMEDDITAIFATHVDKTQAAHTVVKSIHDYIADTLTYNAGGDQSENRSAYTAISGTHQVVCEGYAKMFKVLCKESEIPCIIVTGVAGTTGSKENHMWNYVKIGDYWFLVDCTWDDQDPLTFEYLMAGTHTEGFNGVIVENSHDDSGINFSIDMPDLSYYSYDDLQTHTQHLVTFKSYEDRVYKQVYCGDGCAVEQPDDPEGDIGDHFFGWYIGDEEYNFSNAVTSDITIKAKWTNVRVFTLKYDTTGGTDIQSTREETSDQEHEETAPSKTMKVTKSVPFREGFKFIEWNTAKDGSGISYKAEDEIVLTADEFTLYAIWEDTNSVSYKIDSYVDKAAAFLSEETIPGVSNMLLTIGVITTAVSLLAILAISRK